MGRVLQRAVLVAVTLLGCSAVLLSLRSTTDEHRPIPPQIVRASTPAQDAERAVELAVRRFEERSSAAPQMPVTGDPLAVHSEAPAAGPPALVHAFYYAWYGTPAVDGEWLHWNHPLLPHWLSHVAAKYPKGRHEPPEDIGANFYPELGCYSSADPDIISAHMRQMVAAGIDVVVVSWYSPDRHDDNGKSPDPLMPRILDAAHAHGLRVAFHLEPYAGRSASSVRADVVYIVERYGQHPALYRWQLPYRHEPLPVYYLYDSYQVSAEDWRQVFSAAGRHTLRGTEYDGVFIGLAVDAAHLSHIKLSALDGVYTYFATDGFTYASTWSSWAAISEFCAREGLLFVPSVGPGYDDTAVRPWNGANTRARRSGEYYREAWKAALAQRPDAVSITSFNEWHEGTQIEPAVPHAPAGNRTYSDYEGATPRVYLDITAEMAAALQALRPTVR